MRLRCALCGLLASALWVAAPARAIDASAALSALGFPSDTEQKVHTGQFVETSLRTSSERDLNVGIAFFVKQPPQKLADTLREDLTLEHVDPSTIALGKLTPDATAPELAATSAPGTTPSKLSWDFFRIATARS